MPKLLLNFLLALALMSAGTASAEASPPLRFVGVVENRIWNDNPEESERIAALIAEAGFNSVRVFVPYSPSQAEIVNDSGRICAAAEAAYKHKLALFITIHGVRGSKPGFVPEQSSAVTRLIKTINDYLYWLGGENGCAKEVRELRLEIMNEVNSKTFWRDEPNSPERYVRMLDRVYPAVKRKAKELGLEVTVIAGALAASNNPLGYIKKMGEAARKLGINYGIFDWFSFHPYPGGDLGVNGYPQLRDALKSALGWTPEVLYSEFGVETQIPASKLGSYQSPARTTTEVSEPQQASAYRDFFAQSACQIGVVGGFLFHLLDDPPIVNYWQSGLYYADGTPKSSLPAVRQAALDARMGAITSCG